MVEGLRVAERDRRIAEFQRQGQKVYRWGYTVRKCWQTLWGALAKVRVPWMRGREGVELLVSDGADAITAAAVVVYPTAAPQRCLAHGFRLLGDLTPALDAARRRKFRREFW